MAVDGHGDDAVTAEAQQAEGLEKGGVGLGPGHDCHRRRAGETPALHVPAGLFQDGVAGGGEACEVGHGGAGDERPAAIGGQTEEIEEPLDHALLHGGRDGRADAGNAVLVPGPGQPVGGQRGGKRAPGDEAEIAGSGGGNGGGRSDLVQQSDKYPRINTLLGERAQELTRALHGLIGGQDRPAAEPVQVAGRAPRHIAEKPVQRVPAGNAALLFVFVLLLIGHGGPIS